MKKSKLFRRGMFALLLLLSIFGFACTKPVELTIEGNTDLSIVQGASDVDLLEGVTVKANGEVAALGGDVTLIVSNNGGFDVNKVGEYTITLTASHVKGAVASATRKVTVLSNDKVPPILDVTPKSITHFQGETIDLLVGIKIVDNVDLNTLKATIKDDGGYDKEVPGTYTITYAAVDSAGNEGTATRTIEVVESYTRATFDGDKYFRAVYNPQVGAAYTNSNYLMSYDTTVVNVLSTEYVRYLLANAPERLGGNTGWSLVVLTDENDKVVYMRHFQTGEAAIRSAYPNYNFDKYVKEDLSNVYQTNGGEDMISFNTSEWCTGTTTAENKAYGSAAKGLMMANIEQWLIDGGNVFLFLNSAVDNQSARTFGVNNTMDDYVLDENGEPSEKRTYGLGRTLTVDALDRQTTTQYNKEVGFPIIEVPGSWNVNLNTGIHSLNTRVDYYKGQDLDLLDGVSASHNGVDITSDVTVKVYNYIAGSTTPEGYLGEETTIDAIKEANNGANFLAIYEVVSGEHFDRVAVLVQVHSQTPDQLEVHPGETLFGILMGQKYKLLVNDVEAFTELANVQDAGLAFTASEWQKLENPGVDKGVVVLVDEYYNVVQVNVDNGAKFTIWGNGELVANSFGEGEVALNLDVPTNGFVLVYPEGANGATLKYALNALYDPAYEGGELEADKLEVKVPYGIGLNTEYRIVSSVPVLKINGQSYQIVENDAKALLNNSGSGAWMRDPSYKGYLYYYTKAAYVNAIEAAASSHSLNGGIPYFPQGIAIILDAEGKLVVARLQIQQTMLEIYPDGTVKDHTDGLSWRGANGNSATDPNGILYGLDALIPEDGSVYLHSNFSGGEQPGASIAKVLFRSDYLEGDAPDKMLGKEKMTLTADDIKALTFVKGVNDTDIASPARLARPEVVADGRNLTWNEVANAVKYIVYIGGDQYKTLTETSYVLPATLQAGEKAVQVRAVVAADDASHSNSVLSDVQLVSLTALTAPTLVNTDGVVSWEAVEGAASYNVYVNDELKANLTEELSYDLTSLTPDTYTVKVEAVVAGEAYGLVNSTSEIEVDLGLPPVLEVNGVQVPYAIKTWEEWNTLRADASHVEGAYFTSFVVVTGAEAIANLNDDELLFKNGAMALIGADGKVKYITNRWGIRYTQAAGWYLPSGNTTAAGSDWITNFTAGELKSLVAEGDTLLLASQYAKGELTAYNSWRTYFDKLLMSGVESTSADSRYGVLADLIDLTNVKVVFKPVELKYTINGVAVDSAVKTWEEWNTLRADASHVEGAYFTSFVVVTGAEAIANLNDDELLFKNGAMALIGADGKVKYITNRWGIRYTQAAGWYLPSGNTTAAGSDWITNFTAGELKSLVAEGDTLLLASQYAKGELTAYNSWRTYFDKLLMSGVESTSADSRYGVLANLIDLTNVYVGYKEVVVEE